MMSGALKEKQAGYTYYDRRHGKNARGFKLERGREQEEKVDISSPKDL